MAIRGAKLAAPHLENFFARPTQIFPAGIVLVVHSGRLCCLWIGERTSNLKCERQVERRDRRCDALVYCDSKSTPESKKFSPRAARERAYGSTPGCGAAALRARISQTASTRVSAKRPPLPRRGANDSRNFRASTRLRSHRPLRWRRPSNYREQPLDLAAPPAAAICVFAHAAAAIDDHERALKLARSCRPAASQQWRRRFAADL